MNHVEAVQPTKGKAVFLHVGAPKTGTSFLQKVLWRNRKELASDGVCYPLEWGAEHFDAMLDLRRMSWAGRWDPKWEGAWDRLAQRAAAWEGPRVVISNELLGGATQRQIQRAVDSLAGAQVHVVFTVRDLGRQLPSDWQERLKHRRVVRFEEFLHDLLGGHAPGPWGEEFWRVHGVEAVLGRWSEAVPPAQIHVVAVPRAGAASGLLWKRLAGLLGLEADRYSTGVPPANPSVGVAGAEVLRRVNQALDGRLARETYQSIFRGQLAGKILATRSQDRQIPLPCRWYPSVLEVSQRSITAIRSAGYNVVGDLDELLPDPPPEGEALEADPEGEEVASAAVDAVVALLQHAQTERQRNQQLRARVDELEGKLTRLRSQPFRSVFLALVRRLHRVWSGKWG